MDDPENQLSFKALFRRKFPIFTVEKPGEAKAIINQYPIKIVLSNHQFPTSSAIDFLRWVKEYDAKIIRILVLSIDTNFPITNTHKNQEVLAHQYLWKPWSTKDMNALLLKWWEQ